MTAKLITRYVVQMKHLFTNFASELLENSEEMFPRY